MPAPRPPIDKRVTLWMSPPTINQPSEIVVAGELREKASEKTRAIQGSRVAVDCLGSLLKAVHGCVKKTVSCEATHAS